MGDKYFLAYYPKLAAILLEHQDKNGSWLSGDGNDRSGGRVYCTAMAVLALAVATPALLRRRRGPGPGPGPGLSPSLSSGRGDSAATTVLPDGPSGGDAVDDLRQHLG